MTDNTDLLTKVTLFEQMQPEEIKSILPCLDAKEKVYEKEAYIFTAGKKISQIGIIVEGSVQIVQEDFWGNRMIIAKMGKTGMFGESFVCAGMEASPVSVVAHEKSRIIFINYNKIIAPCSNACNFHSQLIHNMVSILAAKNQMLMSKISHISKRSTREKLLSYLSGEAIRAGSSQFDIPFSRQELADFLSVDRSAMSNELSKLAKDGIISFHKNHFVLSEQEPAF